MTKICNFTQDKKYTPQYKCVLRCCANCIRIGTPSLKFVSANCNMCLTILFHIYRFLSHYMVHGIIPFEEKTCSTMSEGSTRENI